MQSQPVEIVQKILRYVIGVPILFDPEGLVISPEQPETMVNFHSEESILADERNYWEAERHRNACRRVCKNWDAYLRLFEHRLVRVHDVITSQVIPVESLSKAIFVSLVRSVARDQSSTHKDKFIAALRQLDKPTEIRACFFPDAGLTSEQVSVLARMAPNLRMLVCQWGIFSPLHNFSALVHGSICIPFGHTQRELDTLPKSLRSLSIHVIYDGSNDMLKLCETTLSSELLPSLEFLSLTASGFGDHVAILRALLSTLGSRITVLQVSTTAGLKTGADDLLDLCPHVRVFHMTILVPYTLNRPNTHRQIHTFVISLFLTGLKRPIMQDGVLVWPMWTQVRRVISVHRWSQIQTWSVSDLTTWASFWEGSPVRIEDRDGISIQEWLSSQIEHI